MLKWALICGRQKLLKGLIVHLQPAIHRLKFNLVEKNPLKDDIQNQYRNVYDILSRNIELIEKLMK